MKKFLIVFQTKNGEQFERVLSAYSFCEAVMEYHRQCGIEHEWETKNCYPIVYSKREL